MCCTVEQYCRLQEARTLGSEVHLDHLLAVHVRHVMVFLFAMIDNLVARKALMIMFIAMQKVWQQLGHVKLHQRCAAFVHLMQVKGKFTNFEIISAIRQVDLIICMISLSFQKAAKLRVVMTRSR